MNFAAKKRIHSIKMWLCTILAFVLLVISAVIALMSKLTNFVRSSQVVEESQEDSGLGRD